MKKSSSTFLKGFIMMLLFSSNSLSTYATHYAGNDLFYECLGGNQYRVTLVFYRDCSGVSEPVSVNIILTNQCSNLTSAFTINKKPDTGTFTNGQEITSTCTGTVSTCNGGFTPGLRKWTYEGNISVNQTCSDWKISYELCCRNYAITTLQSPGSESLYAEAAFKSNICDHAPMFSNNPIAFACVNQPFNLNQGAYDIDGDSLAYELDNPLSANGNPVTFAAGYSKTNPFSSGNGFTLDIITGGVSFLPNALQVGVCAIKVKQYRNGNLIGYVRRDMEIFVTNCNANTLPVASGFDGTSTYSKNICVDEQLCATIATNDPDTLQNVSISWNSGIAGATFGVSNGNLPTATLCWTPATPDAGNNPHIFTVTVKDNACPANGLQTFTYLINVITKPAISFSKNDASCAGNDGSAIATATPPNSLSYLWSNGVSASSINGLATGTYTVTVTNTSGCSASASVHIGATNGNVALTATTSNDNGNCDGKVDLSVNSGVAPFSYNWSNGSISKDLANVCSSTYTVNVIDASGCAGNSSFMVGLNNGGCNITMTLKGNDEGQCKQGGIITAVISGSWGKGLAILTNSAGSIVAQKNFNKSFAFDGLQHGTYTVTVTDGKGCTASGTVIIGQGNCGAPINVHVVSITSNTARVLWDNCGANKHTVRYKVDGSGNTYNYVSVTNINEALLTNLQVNTLYTVRVKSICGKGKQSPYTIAKKFCTGLCTAPRQLDETDISNKDDDNYISAFDVMPNPSKDVIHLLGESARERLEQIVITNLLGKVVIIQKTYLNRDFDVAIDVSPLPQGVYMVTISGFENNSKRFVKL